MKKVADTRKPRIDWESVEREYRAGIRSLRDIAADYGCSHTAIKSKATREDWTRNLQAKIQAKADALVSKREVSTEVSMETKEAERQIVDTNASMLADKILNQREDVRRARAIVNKLWAQVEQEIDHNEDFEKLGVMLRSEDEFGQDKLNDIYQAAISLPQIVKSVKLLADAIKILIELERKILRIDSMADPDPDAAKRAGAEAGRAVASGVAASMKELDARIKAAKEA